MRGAFRFVCLTDNADGLLPRIEALPIPEVGLWPEDWYRSGVWPKLGIYDGALHGLRGRCVFIDLDMVVLREVDDFFDAKGTYIGVDGGENWGRLERGAAPELCSALISFEIFANAKVADAFRAEPKRLMGSYRNEQAFTAGMLPDIRYWPSDWVISFKRSLRQPVGLDLVLQPKMPPRSAKVLAFHGTPRPMDRMGRCKRFWGRFLHMGHGAACWMVDYWRDNGGDRI